MNAISGAYLWSYATGNWVDSSPAVVGGVVYIGSVDDNVYVLNATSGTQLWNFTTGNWVYSSPAVVGGVVYIGSDDCNVYAFSFAIVAPTVTSTLGTVDEGQTSVLSSSLVTTGISPYSYQWFERAPGGSYVKVGSNSASFSFATSGSTATDSWSFILQVTDDTGSAVNSTVVSVTVNSALATPTVTSTSGAVDQGQTSTLTSTTVSTGTSPYTYQWMEKAPSGSYVDVGTNSASYSFATTGSTATGTWSFELQVTDSTGASVTSSAVSVTVNAALTAPIISVAQSAVDTGQSSTLSVSSGITGGTAPYSYQWMEEAPGGKLLALGSASSSAGSPSTGTLSTTGTWHFELLVTDSGNPNEMVTSNAVTVTVNAALAAPIVSVAQSAVDTGQSSTLSVSSGITGGTAPYSYQWMVEAPGASSYVALGSASSSAGSPSTGTLTTTGTWHFELQVTDSGNPNEMVTSNAVTVTVNAALAAPVVAVAQSAVDTGQSSTLSVSSGITGGTAPFSYQWMEEAPGASSYSDLGSASSSAGSPSTGTLSTTGTWHFELW